MPAWGLTPEQGGREASRAKRGMEGMEQVEAPLLRELIPSWTSWPIRVPVRPGWSRFNPSIAANPAGDGFTLVLRSSNYTVDERLRYQTVDGDPSVRTENLLLSLDPDLAIRSVGPIDDAAVREPPRFIVTGFEDARIVAHRGAWWLSCTTRDRNRAGICQMALLRLHGPRVEAMSLLTTGKGRHEKNWMPVVGCDDGPLRFVYSVSPTIVVVLDDTSMRVEPEIAHPGPAIAEGFRGGSQAIPLDGGHLCLIHEPVERGDSGRLYRHRWVWFDERWQLARLSAPFFLQERGIEFAAGLARRGDDLIISYGVWDRDAWIAVVPVADALKLLAPPPADRGVSGDGRDGRKRERAAKKRRGTKRGHAATTAAAQPAAGPDVGERSTPARSSGPLPTIVSTTLTGNCRKIIGDALRSVVDWVDWCLVIDTGITDDTLAIAREIAGDKLVVRQFPWRGDFAAARNFALAAAHEIGADWAVTLDTDERLLLKGDPRPALAASEAPVLRVMHVEGTYGKERFFRLPAAGSYVGPTHEAFVQPSATVELLDGVWFDELGKSKASYRRKAERDIAILSAYAAAHPDEPRWFYYLGDAYAGLDRHEEAIAAFRQCAGLKGWDEEGAWAMYRAAESLLRLGRPIEAVKACAAGMARHAGMAELPWLAAYASWQAGRPEQAVHWARLSATLGQFIGTANGASRTSFQHPPALWEGPFDVLRFALRATGDDEGADEANRLYAEAKARRKQETRA